MQRQPEVLYGAFAIWALASVAVPVWSQENLQSPSSEETGQFLLSFKKLQINRPCYSSYMVTKWHTYTRDQIVHE